ncbi:hypothetical protein BDN70DRAFT_976616 [Pholiota conissans]|uniref:Uncharacterized protein n=1 Tax=Pholiota conissans TaxID=109636 RepID=A0A9P5YLA2_9AGAR|nr:hypothetical protein BDN70DRAFT_976616 [Pholiota conissans]
MRPEIDVPTSTILSISSLRDQLCWWPNITLSCIFFVTFATASFITMRFYAKEK